MKRIQRTYQSILFLITIRQTINEHGLDKKPLDFDEENLIVYY